MIENAEEANALMQQEAEQIKLNIVEGQSAQELLDNKHLKKWMEESQGKLFDVLDNIALNDGAARQRACDLIYLFRKFEATLKEQIEIGEVSRTRWQEIIEGDKKKGLLSRVFNI